MSPLIIFTVQSTSYDQHDWLVEYLEAIGRGSAPGGRFAFAATQSRDVTVMSVARVTGRGGGTTIRGPGVPLTHRMVDAASLFLDESDQSSRGRRARPVGGEPRYPESLTSKILKAAPAPPGRRT